jgi:hypothetical protein
MSSYDPEERAFGAIRMAYALTYGKWVCECGRGHRLIMDASVDPPSNAAECPQCVAEDHKREKGVNNALDPR